MHVMKSNSIIGKKKTDDRTWIIFIFSVISIYNDIKINKVIF